MSVKYVVQKNTLKNKKKNQNYYPQLVINGVLGTKDLADIIAGRSSLTRGDVRNVIDNLADVMNIQLRNGLSIHLEGFGQFRLGLTEAKTVENEEDARPDSRHLTIRFAPEQDRHSDGKLRTRAMVADNIEFERVWKKDPKKAEKNTQGGSSSSSDGSPSAGNDL